MRARLPGMGIPNDWRDMVTTLESYRPKLNYYLVKWEFPRNNWIKCNTDGALEAIQVEVLMSLPSGIKRGN